MKILIWEPPLRGGGGGSLKVFSVPFSGEWPDWAENLDLRGFQASWDSTKFFNFFTDKNIFSSSKNCSHTFFEKKIQHFFEIWKILGFSKIKKTNTFWTRILSSQKFRFFYFWKFQYFSDFEKMLDFFEKKSNIFSKSEKYWNFPK